MFPWKKKKKDLDTEIKILEQMIESMLNEFFPENLSENEHGFNPKKPIVLGFSLKIGPQGTPYFERFGNFAEQGNKINPARREPLTNVLETDKEIIVTFELPGIHNENINLKVIQDKIELNAKNEKTVFLKSLHLSKKIKKIKQKNFKNGILELVLEK